MLDHIDEDSALSEALGDAEYASLTSYAATDNSRALIDDVLRLITEAEPRERQRVSRAEAFRQAVEGFVGDLLGAMGCEGMQGGSIDRWERFGALGPLLEIAAGKRWGGRS